MIQRARRLRQFQKILFKFLGFDIGKGNTFNGFIKVNYVSVPLTIGSGNVFNEFVQINNRSPVTIGDNCHFSTGVKIITSDYTDGHHHSSPIRIGSNVVIKANSMVFSGREPTIIVDNVVIGPQSIVNFSILEPGYYLGTPVRKLK